MKLDIPYYIRQVLREQRMVHIPGIGTFRLNQSAASFNDDKTIISPPSLSISFDDSDSNDDSLLKYILDTGLLTEAKAKKKIEQFTQSAFNKLLNVDSFLIDGIGTIVKRAGQEKVEFEANLSEFTREFSDLTSLNLTPIARMADQEPLAVAADAKPEIEDSGSFFPRILLLSLLLIALWFIGAEVYKSYFNKPEGEKTEVITKDVDAQATNLDEDNEKNLEQQYEEIDELIDPLNKEDDNQTGDTKLSEELNNLSEQTEPEAVETKVDDADATNTPDAQEDSNNTTANESDSETVVSKGNSEPSSNKYANIIPESGECIIVVGSFIKSLNAIKMVSLLERKGYKVYQSEYKGYKRVGLKYECIDEDLEAFLHDIRKKISKRAWYLDPSLDVPYLKK